MADVATEELQAFKAAFFKALAHPIRIRVLELLVKKEMNVQELQDALGVEQPVVSQQLAVLRANNIVAGRKEGVSVRYSVRDPLSARLRAIADAAGLNAERLAPALLDVREIFSAELAADPRFRTAVTDALASIIAKGANAAVAGCSPA